MSRHAITFRNVNAPNFSSANSLIRGGSDAIQRSIGQLGNIARRVNTQQIDQDKNTFRDRLAGTTLDNINQVDTSNLGRVTQSQAENLINTRRTNLRNKSTSDFNFGETQRKQREAPLIAQANELARSGDVSALDKFINEGEGQGIQDTSALSQTALNQSRSNTQFARTEDKFQDQQAITGLVRQLQGTRDTQVAGRKEANQQFETEYNKSISINGSQERGIQAFTVDPGGETLIFNDAAGLSDAEKTIATDRFEEYKSGLNPLTTDTQQRKQLNNLITQRGATPQQANAAKALLSSNQSEQRALNEDSQEIYSQFAGNADIVLKSQINRENLEFEQFLKEVPINAVKTAQNENIKLGDVLSKIRKQLPGINPDDIDVSDVNEVTDAISKAVDVGYGDNKIPYPGWVIDEAYAQIGAAGIINDNWYGLTESAKTDTFVEALDRVMAQHLQSEDNLSKQTARKNLHNEKLAGYQIANLQNKAKALQAAKNSQGQIKIGR